MSTSKDAQVEWLWEADGIRKPNLEIPCTIDTVEYFTFYDDDVEDESDDESAESESCHGETQPQAADGVDVVHTASDEKPSSLVPKHDGGVASTVALAALAPDGWPEPPKRQDLPSQPVTTLEASACQKPSPNWSVEAISGNLPETHGTSNTQGSCFAFAAAKHPQPSSGHQPVDSLPALNPLHPEYVAAGKRKKSYHLLNYQSKKKAIATARRAAAVSDLQEGMSIFAAAEPTTSTTGADSSVETDQHCQDASRQAREDGGTTAEASPPLESFWFQLHALERYMDLLSSNAQLSTQDPSREHA